MSAKPIPTKWILVNRHSPAHIAERYLYAAFGSNLKLSQIADRCPDAQIIGPAVLEGAQLIFSGVASIVQSQKGSVLCGTYKLSAADIDRLDRFEGVGRVYDRVLVTPNMGGVPVRCFTYIKRTRAPVAPSAAYYARLAEGFKDWQFADKRLRRARERAQKRQWPALFGDYTSPREVARTWNDHYDGYYAASRASTAQPKKERIGDIAELGKRIANDLDRIRHRRRARPKQTEFINNRGERWLWDDDKGCFERVASDPKLFDNDWPEEWET